jgi:hypothetical protein
MRFSSLVLFVRCGRARRQGAGAACVQETFSCRTLKIDEAGNNVLRFSAIAADRPVNDDAIAHGVASSAGSSPDDVNA